MRRRHTMALVALSGVLLVPVHTVAAETTTTAKAVRLAALSPHVPSGATPLGQLPADQPLAFTVVLQPSHTEELSSLVRDLYDPASPRYEKWLATGEFAQRFGPSAAQIARVTSWLREQGLTHTSVHGMAVHATGSAQQVGAALGVSFSKLRLPDDTFGYVASAPPLVPKAVADDIATIVGLSETVRFHSSLDRTPQRIASMHHANASRATVGAAPRGISASAPFACPTASTYAGASFWTADQVGRFYHLSDLFSAGLTGKGKTIALFELGRSRADDTNHYLSCFRLHNAVTVKNVDGGAFAGANAALETEIDIQEAATQAPGASIISYEAPSTTDGELHAYNQIVNDNRAQVVSTSWGTCEAEILASQGGEGFLNALHMVFQQAAAQGQSVFAPGGDSGSEDCYDASKTTPNETLQVDNPGDDPFVTAVGGTALEGEGVEPVWNDCEGRTGDTCAAGANHAGGGGLSTFFKRPAWQPLARNATCTTCREVPDVSANAGVGEVFFGPVGGAGSPPDSWTAVGGTSIAAPMFAGITADIAQGCKSERLGNLAPRLYALAAKHVYGTALTDVTFGINWVTTAIETPGDNDLTRTHGGRYRTAVGFDLATGLGAPIASGLACPQVTSISPNRGTTGTVLTLRGVGLEKAVIKFGSATAKVLSAGPTSAVVIAPAGSGVVNVSGSGPMGTGARPASFSYSGTDSGSYRTVAANGKVFNFGGANSYGAPNPSMLHAPVVGMAVDHATGGYWLAAADGNVYGFNAPFLGDAGAHVLNRPIVGIASTRKGDGYWLVASDGGIFAFGKARFFGSTGGMHLNRPIVGIAANNATGGYWLVASDGGIFAFKAPFHGSTGGMHLNQPIVGIAANNATGGYWLVASDGGVFAFDAPFYGSTGAIHLNKPIVGISATDDARGYRFVASDGGVFNFGDARYSGSTGGSGNPAPVVGVTPAH